MHCCSNILNLVEQDTHIFSPFQIPTRSLSAIQDKNWRQNPLQHDAQGDDGQTGDPTILPSWNVIAFLDSSKNSHFFLDFSALNDNLCVINKCWWRHICREFIMRDSVISLWEMKASICAYDRRANGGGRGGGVLCHTRCDTWLRVAVVSSEGRVIFLYLSAFSKFSTSFLW